MHKRIALIAALVAASAGLGLTGPAHAAPSNGATTLAVTGPGGAAPNENVSLGSVSRDGRWLAFTSRATNLFAAATDDALKLVVRDTSTGVNRLVVAQSAPLLSSGGPYGIRTAGFSDDGRYLAFDTAADPTTGQPSASGLGQVYVADLQAGTLAKASVASNGDDGDGNSQVHGLSGDGTKVVFESLANNLGAPSGNGQLYWHDMLSGRTQLVTADASGVPSGYQSGAGISFDGAVVSYQDNASVWVKDMRTGVAEDVDVMPDGSHPLIKGGPTTSALSADGNRVLFMAAWQDSFVWAVRDRALATTSIIAEFSSSNSMGEDGALSPDGKTAGLVVADSLAPTAVTVTDVAANTTRVVSVDDSGQAMEAGQLALPDGGDRVFFSAEQPVAGVESPIGFDVADPPLTIQAYLHDFSATPAPPCPDGGVQNGVVSGPVYAITGSQLACSVLVPNGL